MRNKRSRIQKLKRRLFVFLIFIIGIGSLLQMPLAQKIFYPYPYRPTVEKYAREYGVDPYLVIAVIRAESSFMPQSESHKGALGLMQLMPNTASDIAEKMDDKSFTQEELKDPEKNIQYGTWYLANLQKEFNNIALTVAAYNGGRGHVKEWISTQQIDPNNLQIADIPFQETRQYVQRVLQFYDKYKELYGY
ncbi:lytic transglycosylase domain-containing protein [Desulfitobacterium metallireducens]|uniref:Transglycosylase n=1 Tax=Desulfitobacterium metallireducens DSM 15288 TaxID=871968 RepID=W0EBI4_9FIRM|nr:transglycosylase [Desulfitobacterium metallireducens DSM 15288]